jgi:hypothetical protein
MDNLGNFCLGVLVYIFTYVKGIFPRIFIIFFVLFCFVLFCFVLFCFVLFCKPLIR